MSGSPQIQFDDFEIDAAAFELRRGGQVCAVEPQVFELLLYLARHPDQLITRNDLIRDVWCGRSVSDSTVASRIKSARRAIGDDGVHQRRIKTVHGRGVRFVGEGSTGGAPIAIEPRWPTIAVLPFANIGGDPEQGYFADGVTEDIVTDLSRFREQRVVARDSCSRFRNAGGDPQRIGRELGADYVVTGSIRRRGSKLRLSAHLTSVETGNEVWADRFDRNAEDIFAVADEVVHTIAATLAGRVRSAGSALARRKPPANLAAYDCLLRGQAALRRLGYRHEESEARRFFEQALASDPGYARAHSGLATVLLREWFRKPDSPDTMLDRALDHAWKAVSIDGDDHECQETLGWILLHRKEFDLAEQHYRRALELNPNSPDELAAMGSVCSFLGRPDEGIGWFEQAKRVDPFFDPTWYWHLLVSAYFNARRYDEAIAAYGHCTSTPGWATAYAAASHAMAGRLDAARDLAAALKLAAPHFRGETLARKEPFRNPADFDHLLSGLRRAGLLTDSARRTQRHRDGV